MDASLANALVAAQQYYYDPCDTCLGESLENALLLLTQSTNEFAKSITCQADIESNAVLLRFLCQLRALLQAKECLPSILAAIFTYLTEIAWFSPILRKHLQRKSRYEVPLCLNALYVKRNKLDDAIWTKCLKFLQLFTYDCKLTWHPLAMDLVSVLFQEVCSCSQNVKAELLPHCLGILLNYGRQVPEAIHYIKLQDNIQAFNRTLLLVLKEASASLVILSTYFVILAFQDIHEANFSGGTTVIKTMKCITNVIGRGQSFMSRFYAVDLFLRFVNETSVRRHLLASGHFSTMLSELCTLFDSLSASLEQVVKVYEMFLFSCQLDGVQQAFCNCLLSAGPTNQQRLTSPLLAVLQMAKSDPETLGGFVELPCQAIRVLQCVFGHVLTTGDRLPDYVAPESLVQLLEDSLKITLETGHPLVKEKSKIVHEALVLATLVSRDASVRADVVETVDTVLCAHLAHFQLLSNPIGSSSTDTVSVVPEWSLIGVQIILAVIQYLRQQCAISKSHSLLCDDLTKDERLLPFVAFAIVSGEDEIVRSAFSLVNSITRGGSKFNEKLADLVSKSGRRLRLTPSSSMSRREKYMDDGEATPDWPSTFEHYEENASRLPNLLDEKRLSDLDAVLNKLRSTQIIDKSVSSIIEIYEANISASQLQIEHLKEQLRLRIESVQRSDNLFSKFLVQNQNAKKEEERLRGVLRRTVIDRDELAKQLEESNSIIGALTKRLACMDVALDSAKREIDSEKELHSTLREHYNKMKSNFEAVSIKLLRYEEEAKKQKGMLKHKIVDSEGMA